MRSGSAPPADGKAEPTPSALDFSAMSKRRLQAGFTLVEVMITLTILVIIGASVSQTMVTSYETKRIVTEQNGRYHEGRQVLTRMAREMRMAFLRAEVPRISEKRNPRSSHALRAPQMSCISRVRPMSVSMRRPVRATKQKSPTFSNLPNPTLLIGGRHSIGARVKR